MEAIRVETRVQQNGRIVIENLPFEEGKGVEVIVLEQDESARKSTSDNPYPLRGTSYKYDDPFSPLLPDEVWEPLK